MNWKITKWTVVLILFIIGLFCYMKDYGYCNVFHIPVEEEFKFEHYEFRKRHDALPDRNQKKQWQEAYDNHHFHAVRTYQDAYDRVWWLPDLSWRQIGRDAWVAACTTACTKTPTQALVVAFSSLLSSYGLHCLDEWDYIQDKLYWSQYHFEQCAYYSNLLYGD